MRAIIVVTLALCLTVTELTIYPQPISAHQPPGQPAIPLDDVDRLLREGRRAARDNQYPTAIAAYEKALALVRTSRDRSQEIEVLSRLGAVYSKQDQYKRAVDYYQQAFQVAEAIGNNKAAFTALIEIGESYQELADLVQAGVFFQKALDLAIGLKDPEKIDDAFGEFVNVIVASQDASVSKVDRLKGLQTQILAIAQQLEQPRVAFYGLKKLCRVYRILNQPAESLTCYQNALALLDQYPPSESDGWGRSGDRGWGRREDRVEVLLAMAKVYRLTNQAELASGLYRQIQGLALQSPDPEFKTETLDDLASAYQGLKQYQEARNIYQILLKIAQQTPPDDRPSRRQGWGEAEDDDSDLDLRLSDETERLIQLSVVHTLLNDPQASADYQRQAIASATPAKGPTASKGSSLANHAKFSVLTTLAETYSADLGRYDQALDLYQQAATIARQVKAWESESEALLEMGDIYLIQGPYTKAIQSFQQVIALYSQNKNADDIDGPLLRQLGLAYYQTGNYSEALKFYNQAATFNKSARSQARMLMLLGPVYQSLGQPQMALELYQKAIATRYKLSLDQIPDHLQNPGRHRPIVEVLDRLGTTYQALNQPQQALQSYQQALNWFNNNEESEDDDTEDRDLKARLLNHLGLTQQSLGQNTAAIAAHSQALSIFRQTRNLAGEASALHNLGLAQTLSLAQTQGQPDLARQSLQQALGLRRSLGDLEGEASTLNALGTVLDQQQQPQLALLFYKQSVNTYESIRQFLRPLDRSLQQSYTDSVAGAYRRLADRLIAQGRIGEAQTTLELLRLQELNDFSRGTRSAQPAPLAYSKTETKLKTQYGSLIAFGQTFYQCESQQCAQLPQLREQLRNLNRDFDKLVQTLIIQQTERATQKTDDFLTSADKIVNVQPHTVLIYPLVLDNKVWLLWAAQGVTGKAECPLDRPTLNQTVATFRQALLDPNSDNSELHPPAQKLYDCLIRPLEPELQKNGIQHLIFVPDRVTNYIPMAALHDGQKYLIENYSIANILSAKLTDVSDRLSPNRTSPAEVKPKGTRALAFGLSESRGNFSALPYVPDEIDSIVKSTASDPTGIYPGQTLLNKAFSRTALEDSLNGQQILHIATHAAFVASNPRESYLVLGTGETYPISEIQRLRGLRDVHLVVLSACETGIGGIESNGGIEVSGISSYFLEDRAKAVLASLWKVNDESTSLWMQGFYQRLNQDSITKAESIRQVQLAFLQGKAGEGRFIHPYYWAPFVLLGNSW